MDIFVKNVKKLLYNSLELLMVGIEGFEPPTSCSQSRRASQTTLYSDFHKYKKIIW